MPSQFFGLNIAYTGLTASNAALNTTGNNISNVKTEGYSRQTVTQQASEALRTFTTYGCAGSGVDTIAIERVRDEFYDVRYWNNNAKLGEYEPKQYYMEQMENYFKDEKTNVGFNTIFNQLSTALAELKKNPGDSTVKSQYIGYANNLAEYFNNMSESLSNMQKDVNSEIKVQVDSINTYAEQIASLNKQINVIEMTGTTANELRDQRSLVIDKLSKIVDVSVSETAIMDSNNPDRTTGGNNYLVRIAGGQTLVNSGEYNSLECVARETTQKVNQSDASGLYDIYWSNGIEFNLNNAAMGGQLRGLFEMRDGNNSEYFNGMVSSIGQTTIGTTNYSTATVSVTADYLKDLSKCTLSDTGGEIKLGNLFYNYDSFSFNYNSVTDSYSYTFVLSTNNENALTDSRIGKDASVGNGIDYQGIPYYMEQMNEWVRGYSKAYNDILTQANAVDGYGNTPEFLFMANKATDTTQYSFADSYPATASYSISSTQDSYFYLTAKNFAINKDIVKDAELLATRTGAEDGKDKSDVVEDLIAMNSDKKIMSFRGSSAGDFLQCMLSDVALNASRANTFQDNYDAVKGSIDIMRKSISGVDEDEEALNLVKYQNAYNLASKMIQTLSEIYDRLILQTGV